MPAARLAIAALRIPWKELLKAAPSILRAAGEVIARLPNRQRVASEALKAPTENAALVTRLEALETSAASQAELAKDMATQLQEITEALRIVALRALLALIAAVVGLALALTAFIRTFS